MHIVFQTGYLHLYCCREKKNNLKHSNQPIVRLCNLTAVQRTMYSLENKALFSLLLFFICFVTTTFWHRQFVSKIEENV